MKKSTAGALNRSFSFIQRHDANKNALIVSSQLKLTIRTFLFPFRSPIQVRSVFQVSAFPAPPDQKFLEALFPRVGDELMKEDIRYGDADGDAEKDKDGVNAVAEG